MFKWIKGYGIEGVSSFEDGFANGYRYGELFWKTGFISERDFLHSYKDTDAFDTVVNNFNNVVSTLKSLDIKVDPKQTEDIIARTTGSAVRLTYKIKMAVARREKKRASEALATHSAPSMQEKQQKQEKLRETGGSQGLGSPPRRVVGGGALASTLTPRGAAEYMQFVKDREVKLIQKMLPEEQRARHFTSKFTEDYYNNTLEIKKARDTDAAFRKTTLLNQRTIRLDNFRDNVNFKQDWEKEGKKNWKKNRKITKDRIAYEKQLEREAEEALAEKKRRARQDELAFTYESMTHFDQHLERVVGVGQSDGQPPPSDEASQGGKSNTGSRAVTAASAKSSGSQSTAPSDAVPIMQASPRRTRLLKSQMVAGINKGIAAMAKPEALAAAGSGFKAVKSMSSKKKKKPDPPYVIEGNKDIFTLPSDVVVLDAEAEARSVTDQTMHRIHEKNKSDNIARKERDRRRRKLMVDQAKAAEKAQQVQAQEAFVQRMLKVAMEQRTLGEEEWRSSKLTDLKKINGSTAMTMLVERRHKNYVAQADEYQEFDQHHLHIFQKKLNSQGNWYATLRNRQNKYDHRHAVAYCKCVMTELFDIAWRVIDHREKTQSLVKPMQWRKWMAKFRNFQHIGTDGLPVDSDSDCENFPVIDNDSSEDEEELGSESKAKEETSAAAAKASDAQGEEEQDEDPEEIGYIGSAPAVPEPSEDNAVLFEELNVKVTIRGATKNVQYAHAGKGSVRDEAAYLEYCNGKLEWSALANVRKSPVEALAERVTGIASGKISLIPSPVIPRHLVCMSLQGHPYTGKRELAGWLRQQHNILLIDVNVLVQKAVAQEEEEENAGAKGGAKGKGKGAKAKGGHGAAIKKLLAAGKPIDDTILVALAVERIHQIQARHDQMKNSEFQAGLSRSSSTVPDNTSGNASAVASRRGSTEKKSADDEPDAAAAARQVEEEADPLKDDSFVVGGWALYDFPASPAQAALLEKELTGFVAAAGGKAGKGGKAGRAQTPEEMAEKEIFPSGIDLVLRLEALESLLQSRAVVGVFVDPETGTIYQESDLPEDEEISSRLVPGSEKQEAIFAQLEEQLGKYNATRAAMVEWWANFNNLEELDANEPANEIQLWVSHLVTNKDNHKAELAAAAAMEGTGSKAPSRSGSRPASAAAVATPFADVAAKKYNLGQFEGKFAVEVAKQLDDRYRSAVKVYEYEARCVFRALEVLKKRNVYHFIALRKHFIETIRNTDQKMPLLSEFRSTVLDAKLTRKEKRFRAEEVGDSLWDFSDVRKNQVEDLLARINSDGWVQNTIVAVVVHCSWLLQRELDFYKQ